MTLDPRIRKTVVLCRCGGDRFICVADVRRQIAILRIPLSEAGAHRAERNTP